MSGSKLIVVVGATGSQGGSVARTFSKITGWRVRGISRNTTSKSSVILRDLGVEMMQADLNSKDSLISAFKGADAIFGVTDFWQFASDPATLSVAKERGIKANVVAMEREITQFNNIVDAAAHVLATEGKLERLVLSSLSYSRKLSNGEITENLHFDGKAIGVERLQTSSNPSLVALCEKTSYVQIGHYLDNWSKGYGFGPQQIADGTFVYKTHALPPFEDKVPMVHPPTDTGPFVEALVLRNPSKTTMLGTSQELTTLEYAELLSKHFKKPVRVVKNSREETLKSAGEVYGLEVMQSGEYVSKYGWYGGVSGVKRPWDLHVDMSALTMPDQYIRETDWSDIMLQQV